MASKRQQEREAERGAFNPRTDQVPFEQPLEYPHPLLKHSGSPVKVAACQMSEWPGWKPHHSPECPGCMTRLAAAAIRSPKATFRVIETGETMTMVEGFRMRVPDETNPLRVMFERGLKQARAARKAARLAREVASFEQWEDEVGS